MTLHIFPDEKFVDDFIARLNEYSLTENKYVVNTPNEKLKSVKADLEFAAISSAKFKAIVGNTYRYKAVYIHYLGVDMYRWIILNKFKKLGWMIWGADLYQLPFIRASLYEAKTKHLLIEKDLVDFKRRENIFYKLKYSVITPLVYSKIDAVCTWMTTEFEFARRNLPMSKKVRHEYFRYSLSMDWDTLDTYVNPMPVGQRLSFVLGNSASFTNNHIDLFDSIGDVVTTASVPLSYGNQRYAELIVDHVRSNFPHFKSVRKYMSFGEYIQFLNDHSGLIMNIIRPQGMGNIWIMMYLGKLIFLNERCIVFDFLKDQGFDIYPISAVKDAAAILKDFDPERNRKNIKQYFSDSKLRTAYTELFGNEN